jgi:TP901 family phage tail tape measure protein
VRTIGVKLTADTSGYISGLARAQMATKDFTGQMDKAAKTGHLDKVADQAAKFGIAGVAAFGLVVKSAADFDKQMSAVSAATHANTQDMAALRAAALQAGKDTQYSATEAAKGITELSKAGVSTADVLGGGLKGALSLAAAGQLDVGEAAETAASAMTQFKLSGDQVPHVADLLAAAAGKAQGSVHDLGYALSQSGLVASQMGLSIEDATGTLAAFASAGLLGSDAGTSFKTMMLALQNPSAKTAGLMKDLGISAYDTQGNFVGITKFAGILQEKLKDLTPQMRQQALAQMFGNDAVRAGTILYDQGAKGIQGWINKTNDAGYAAETASKLTDNLSGDIERLKGSLETLAIQSGSGSNSGLRILAQSLNGVVGQFLGMPPAVGATVTVLAGLGGVAALSLVAFIKLRKGMAEAVLQLNAMGPAGEKAAVGLSRVTSVAGKAVGVLAGLEVLGMVADHFGAAAVNVDRLTDSLSNLATTGKSAGELNDVFGKDMKNFALAAKSADAASHGFWGGLNDLTSSIPGVGSAVDALNERIHGMSFNQAKDSMTGLDGALVNFMNTTKDYNKASALWQQMLIKSGLNTEQLAALLPNAYKQLGVMSAESMKAKDGLNGVAGAAKGVAGPTGKAADATKEYADAADAAAGAARGEVGALTDLSNRMKAEIDPVFGLITAEQGLTKAQKDAAAAVKTHGRNSVEAKAATRELALAAIDLQGKAGALSSSFDGKLSPALVKTFKAAGLTDGQIKDVAKQAKQAKADLDKYDGKYVADVSARGVKGVAAQLATLGDMQKALKSGTAPKGGWNQASGALAKAINDPKLRADGGPISGPGGPREDAIPAMLSNGEYVHQASAVDYYGQGAMNAINNRQIPKEALAAFKNGGLVGWPFPATAAMTRIPSKAEAMNAVIPAGPSGGGQTYKWIEAVARGRFPGIQVISDYRPGARTLSGNLSYHGFGRAVDFAPSRPLAQFFHDNYMSRLKELITPYNDLNVWNGRPHRYTGAIWNQHNFAGGNAHDHVAMASGGVIGEPVFGVGASGRTYSFAENGPERVLPTYATASHGSGGGGGGNVYQITINPTPLAHPRDIGRQLVGAIQAYESGSGRTWRTGRNAT